jgi:hypothetical protein
MRGVLRTGVAAGAGRNRPHLGSMSALLFYWKDSVNRERSITSVSSFAVIITSSTSTRSLVEVCHDFERLVRLKLRVQAAFAVRK